MSFTSLLSKQLRLYSSALREHPEQVEPSIA